MERLLRLLERAAGEGDEAGQPSVGPLFTALLNWADAVRAPGVG